MVPTERPGRLMRWRGGGPGLCQAILARGKSVLQLKRNAQSEGERRLTGRQDVRRSRPMSHVPQHDAACQRKRTSQRKGSGEPISSQEKSGCPVWIRILCSCGITADGTRSKAEVFPCTQSLPTSWVLDGGGSRRQSWGKAQVTDGRAASSGTSTRKKT